MEYSYSTTALDQTESWNIDLDASQIYLIPTLWNYLEMYPLLKTLKWMDSDFLKKYVAQLLFFALLNSHSGAKTTNKISDLPIL